MGDLLNNWLGFSIYKPQWSSGLGRRLVIRRSEVQVPVTHKIYKNPPIFNR